MQSSLSVITAAEEFSLVTLYEAKLALNLLTASATLDDQIEMIVEWSSAEIATTCNRVFAKETITETFRGFIDGSNCRIFLARYPVLSIDTISEDKVALIEGTDFEIEMSSGKLTRLGQTWMGPVTVTYTGGYELPNDSPRPLRQATILLAREAYYATIRGDATIRMISHKDSRVIYFDPMAALKAMGGGGAGGGGGTPARRAIGDLLKNFMRFEI